MGHLGNHDDQAAGSRNEKLSNFSWFQNLEEDFLNLESAVETPGDGDTLGGTAWVGERRLQRLDGALRLLQLFHQGVHCLKE